MSREKALSRVEKEIKKLEKQIPEYEASENGELILASNTLKKELGFNLVLRHALKQKPTVNTVISEDREKEMIDSLNENNHKMLAETIAFYEKSILNQLDAKRMSQRLIGGTLFCLGIQTAAILSFGLVVIMKFL